MTYNQLMRICFLTAMGLGMTAFLSRFVSKLPLPEALATPLVWGLGLAMIAGTNRIVKSSWLLNKSTGVRIPIVGVLSLVPPFSLIISIVLPLNLPFDPHARFVDGLVKAVYHRWWTWLPTYVFMFAAYSHAVRQELLAKETNKK